MEIPLWEVDGRSFWNALAKQAEANLMQAGANLKQAEANRAMSNAILSQTQGTVSSECVAAMEPDRLESWYAANSDAVNVTTIAGKIVDRAAEHIVHQAEGPWQDKPQSVDSTQGFGMAGGKGAAPEKAEASQAVVAKPIVGTKRRVPSILELLTAQAADALVAEGDKKGAGIEASGDGSEDSTTHPVTVPSSAQAPAGSGVRAHDDEGATIKAKSDGPIKSVEITLKLPEGLIKSLEAKGIVADVNGVWKRCAGP